MTEAKAFSTFTRIYALFKSEHLSANIKLTLNKALIRSVIVVWPSSKLMLYIVVLYCCPSVSMDTCLSPNWYKVYMVAEGNYLVVYMYENVVQSSLNLRSEQRFYFISSYHEDQVYFINYYNSNDVCLPHLGISGRHPPLKIAAHAKQGSAHHWEFFKAHTGPRFAHSFQTSVCIGL
jgi:hypothetical protein